MFKNLFSSLFRHFGSSALPKGTRRKPATGTRRRLGFDSLEDRLAPANIGIIANGPEMLQPNEVGHVNLLTYNAGNTGVSQGNLVHVTLPAGQTFVQSLSNLNVFGHGNHVWVLGRDLAPGQVQQLSFDVRSNGNVNGKVVTHISVSSLSRDVDLRNNVASFVTSLERPNADLQLSLRGPQTAIVGDAVSYTVSVTDNSSTAAMGTRVTIPIPVGLTFDRRHSSPAFRQQGSFIVGNFGTIAGGQTIDESLVFTARTTGRSTLSAIVSSTTRDPNLMNNQAVTQTLIQAQAPSVRISLDGDSHVYAPNQQGALLTTVRFGVSTNESIDARSVYVAIRDHHATDYLSTTGELVMRSLHLRNPVTGRTIVGVPVSSNANDTDQYDIYRFSNFTFQDGQEFQIVGDINPSVVLDGDTLSAFVITTPVGGPPVTIDGLVWPLDNNLDFRTFAGTQVTNVQPVGYLQSSPHPIVAPALHVAVKSLGTSDVIVKNQKNVPFYRFEMSAVGQDMLTTRIELKAQQGNLFDAQNYTLWVDTDGNAQVDTILQKGVSSSGGKIVFNNLLGGGFITPLEMTTIFEVHADVSASLSGNTLQLSFATDSPSYLEAETVDRGTSLIGIKTNGVGTGEIVVTTTPSITYTIVSQGNLFVTKDFTPIRDRQLLLGTLADTTIRLRFRAEFEDVDVTDLQFEFPIEQVSVSRLELYFEGANTPFAHAGHAGTDLVAPGTLVAKMQSRQLVIPKGMEVIVIVRARMMTDVEGGQSGDKVQLRINPLAVSNNATGQGAVRARGGVSSNNLSANNGNGNLDGEVFIGVSNASPNAAILGRINDVVGSKITVISNANPDANGSSVPTGVSNIGQFKFTAAQNQNSKNGLNKVAFDSLILTVNNVNTAIDASSLKFFNKADSTQTVVGIPMNASGQVLTGSITGNFYVMFTGLATSIVNTYISQGTDQTFVLQANITNPAVSGTSTSALQVSLTNFSDRTLQTFGILGSHLSWIDYDDNPFRKTFFWIEYPETVIKSTSYQS